MRQEFISSVQNPQVKEWHQLLTRKGREESGRFLIEGAHLVEEALRSQAAVQTVIYDQERGLPENCEKALASFSHEVRMIAVTPQVLAKLSETKSPQAVMAVLLQNQQNQEESWSRLLSKQEYLLLFVDELQDPGNLGTILRTADAAGADGVVLGEGSVDLYNGKVIRATMGSLFRIPVFAKNVIEAMDQVKSSGGRVLVTALSKDSKVYDSDLYHGKCAIVIGNEGRGVSPEALRSADEWVHIPLYGGAESLNAAVACGIMLYEAQRQRKRN